MSLSSSPVFDYYKDRKEQGMGGGDGRGGGVPITHHAEFLDEITHHGKQFN